MGMGYDTAGGACPVPCSGWIQLRVFRYRPRDTTSGILSDWSMGFHGG